MSILLLTGQLIKSLDICFVSFRFVRLQSVEQREFEPRNSEKEGEFVLTSDDGIYHDITINNNIIKPSNCVGTALTS